MRTPMIALFTFSLIVGGGLLLVSLVSDLFGDADIGHVHVGDLGHADGFQIVSLRTLTYFLFAFGGVGLALAWGFPEQPLLALAGALAAGLGLGAIVVAAFRYLRASQSGQTDGESSFVGLMGTVRVPLSHGGRGKVVVRRGDRTYELVARPFEQQADTPGRWREVMVVDMQQGTALVAPVDEALRLEGDVQV